VTSYQEHVIQLILLQLIAPLLKIHGKMAGTTFNQEILVLMVHLLWIVAYNYQKDQNNISVGKSLQTPVGLRQANKEEN